MRRVLLVLLAASLLVAFVAVPVQAAKPIPAITGVNVTSISNGTGGCLWTLEATVENFHGPQRDIRVGVRTGSAWEIESVPVKGKVTTFTHTIETEWTSLDGYVMNLRNKKDSNLASWAVSLATSMECGT